MKYVMIGLSLLFLLAGTAASYADETVQNTKKNPQLVIEENCRLEAQDAGIAPDEMEDYVRQCIGQQKFWQDNDAFGDQEGGDESDGGSGDDNGMPDDDYPSDDNSEDNWGSS